MVDAFDSYRLGFQTVALFLVLGAAALFIARRPRLPLEPADVDAAPDGRGSS